MTFNSKSIYHEDSQKSFVCSEQTKALCPLLRSLNTETCFMIIDFFIRPPLKSFMDSDLYSNWNMPRGIFSRLTKGRESTPATTQGIESFIDEFDASGIDLGVVIGSISQVPIVRVQETVRMNWRNSSTPTQTDSVESVLSIWLQTMPSRMCAGPGRWA